ncbi:MAG TPA: excinuclease ABC subunit UvrC [Pseudomonadota bacterium]|nr:excinuclease ABC subunit UvrC [Pseudomonadota bacterium]
MSGAGESAGNSPFDGKAFVRTLATRPGVYRMLDAQAAVLYVGKAKDLRKRVGSYFLRPALQPRIAAMLQRVATVEVTVTRTEAEALLLENELIKSLKPRYNVLLRDDKSFPLIHLSGAEDYPRMGFHRGARSRGGRYFGPYPSTTAVRETLNLMQKLFRVRQCEDTYFRNRTRPCLQHQIGRCSAPCVGLVTPAQYQHDVRHATLFLDGQTTTVVDELAREMEVASTALEFERAAALRDRIANIKRIQARQYVSEAEEDADVLACRIEGNLACVHGLFFRNGVSLGGRSWFPRIPEGADEGEALSAFVAQYYLEHPAPALVLVNRPVEEGEWLAGMFSERRGRKVEIRHAQRGERARLVEIAERNAEQAIATEAASKGTLRARWQGLADLLQLGAPPARVECFDISHTMGEATVASCVVFDAGGPVKSQYRRYNISGLAPGDDYGAMRQALARRFKRGQAEGGPLPDLLLVDGGKGQVAEARAVLADLGIDGVDVVGVAKGSSRKPGLEQLLLGAGGRVLTPPGDAPGLHLIQQIRDEAHRFAIGGHRQRRQRARDSSELEKIPGVGTRRRSALLRHFGGWAGVVEAGIDELARVPGIERALATRIYAALHG